MTFNINMIQRLECSPVAGAPRHGAAATPPET